MKKILLVWMVLFQMPVFAQPEATDITGVWKGEFYVDSTRKLYPYELSISEDKGRLSGYSRIAFEENGIKHVVFRDHKIRIEGQTVIIEDDNQLAKASSISQPKEVKKTMLLNLTVTDSSLLLSGTWSTNRTRRFLAATGTARLQKKNEFRETEIFRKLDELALADKLSFTKTPEPPMADTLVRRILYDIAKADAPVNKKKPASVSRPNPSIRPRDIVFARLESAQKITTTAPAAATAKPVLNDKAVAKTDTKEKPVTRPAVPAPVFENAAVDVAKRSNISEQALYYQSDSLQITLYDNGEIDGDTVSVLLNGKVIIAKKGLDTKPNSYTVYFDRNSPDSQMLVMYAENLGSIPPNTGLLVIREGKSVYELRFSADLSNNAAIILRRKKSE